MTWAAGSLKGLYYQKLNLHSVCRKIFKTNPGFIKLLKFQELKIEVSPFLNQIAKPWRF